MKSIKDIFNTLRVRLGKKWALTVHTETRNDLIKLGMVMANSLPHKIFLKKDIPIIVVTQGQGQCKGKSLLVEAMMKNALDEFNPRSMMAKHAPQEFFLEEYPGQALRQYLGIKGHMHGKPVFLSFDRVTDPPLLKGRRSIDLITPHKNAAKKHNAPAHGAIFRSGVPIDQYSPWIVMELSRAEKKKSFKQDVHITIHNINLKKDMSFYKTWTDLKKQAKNGTIFQTLEASNQNKPDLPSMEGLVHN